jgi:hypothetical protein
MVVDSQFTQQHVAEHYWTACSQHQAAFKTFGFPGGADEAVALMFYPLTATRAAVSAAIDSWTSSVLCF